MDASAPQRLLVTGANGQLGRDVIEAAANAGHRALGLGRGEFDVTDPERVRELVATMRPTAIVHCAAYTAVDEAEADRKRAFLVNETGTRNIAQAAKDVGAYLVTVSTDYVFPGDSETGYAEDDATDPINVYGESKLAAERETLAVPGAAVARTAWLFGRTGTNFVRTIARLAGERDELDVVTDQVGSPTYSRHLAQALVRTVELRIPGVLHLAGEPTATWFEVAQEIVSALGVDCAVRPTTSDRFPRPAARPTCSILRVTRGETPRVGDWRDGVREVVSAMPVATLAQ